MAKEIQVIKPGPGHLPDEIKLVIKEIHERLNNHKEEFAIDPRQEFHELYFSRPRTYTIAYPGYQKEWVIGSNYEDGTTSTIWFKGRWFYRDSWTGRDRLVPGGRAEVIANWVCYYTA